MTLETTSVGSTGLAKDEYPSLTHANYALGLLFVTYLLSFLDRQVLTLLVGPIREQFGLSDFQFSLLQGAAFAVTYTIAGIPLGRLADRYSRRWIIAGSIFSWSVMTCACGWAKSYSQLFLARMGVGIGEAGLSPAAYSIITDSYHPDHMGYALSFYKMGVTVGGGLALVLGGMIYDFYLAQPSIEWPLLGELKPWQATLITAGLPGFVLCILMGTIQEPSRKGVAISKTSATDAQRSFPFMTVIRFLWQRKRLYGVLFLGSSFLSIANYGSAAWYPEMLARNYGLSKSETGSAFGMIYLIAGTIGVMAGPFLASRLQRAGYADANVRTVLIASIVSILPATLAPLMGSAESTLLVLWPTVFISMTYLGIMAVSFQLITPNEMRGQTTAIYIFVTNIMGMAVGTSVLAGFTDFLFQDDLALPYSIAAVNAVFYPLAAALFWYCLPAYRASLAEAGNWRV